MPSLWARLLKMWTTHFKTMKKKTGKKVTRTMPTRSNKGGSMRGKERAAYVKAINSERKAAMPAKASKKKVGKKKATRLTGLAKARSVGGKAYGKGGKNNAAVLSTPTTTARRKTTRKMPLLGRIRKMRKRMGR